MAKPNHAPDELSGLKAAIKAGSPERLYFFHGEEVFLLHHYLNELRKKTIEELTQDFNSHRFTQETFSVQAFSDAVEALPMMAERTFVQVDEIDIFKLNENEREKMIEIFSDVPDYCTVVFTYEIVEWKPDKRLKKLWEAVSKNGTIVEFAKQSQRDLIAWVTRHFASHHKKISTDLCAYLIDITGGTMTALQGEIKKIAAYSGADTIVKSDIDAVTEPVLDAVVFQMTDLLGSGKYGESLLKLQTLLKMQEEPIAILGAMTASRDSRHNIDPRHQLTTEKTAVAVQFFLRQDLHLFCSGFADTLFHNFASFVWDFLYYSRKISILQSRFLRF